MKEQHLRLEEPSMAVIAHAAAAVSFDKQSPIPKKHWAAVHLAWCSTDGMHTLLTSARQLSAWG